MRRSVVTLLFLSSVAVGLGRLSAQGQELPRANTVVEPRAYVSLEPVPRGRAFEVAVVAKIRRGFHINANKVAQDYLIPTSIEAALPPGFRVLDTAYPPGILRKFKFSAEEMLVYEGRTTLRMKLQALADAPLGPAKLALTLHYQACNEEACLPPVKLPLHVEFTMAPAGASAHPANSSIFQPSTPKTASPRSM